MKQLTAELPRYVPFNVPPEIVLSKLHRECTKFGPPNLQGLCCPCCSQYQRQTLPISCSSDQIYQINEPVGIYFYYIKTMCIVLLIVMLITGVYSLVEIINQCSADETSSLCVFVYGIPITKIHVFFKMPSFILNVIVIVVLYLYAGFLFFKVTYFHQKTVCHHELPSDMSVLLSNVNYELLNVEMLGEELRKFEVRDIIVTHKIKKYMKKLSERSVCEAKCKIFQWKDQKHQAEREASRIREIENGLLHVKNSLTLGQDRMFRTDKVILTFQSVESKRQFQDSYRLGLCRNILSNFCGESPLIIEGCPLFIQPLGQPDQLIWQNLEVTSKTRYFRIFVSNFISLALLGCSFFLIMSLTVDQKNRDASGDVLMAILFSVLIEATNFLFSLLIGVLTHWQSRYTLTAQMSIKLYKNCIGFFLNTTLIPFSLFAFSLFQTDEDDLIRNIMTLFFISNLLSPFLGLYLHPQFLYKVYGRRKIEKQGYLSLKTQIQSNHMFEKIGFMLDERYALICQLFMNCLFYAAIFPVGILITIVGMIIAYWVSKWWLLNLCSIPKFSFRLAPHICVISCYFPSIYAFGYAANLYMVQQPSDFDRQYALYLALATIPLTLLWIMLGEKVAHKWIRNRRTSVMVCLNKQKHFLTYKALNPTSFFHSTLPQQLQKNESTLWDHLLSYVIAKQSKLLHRADRSSLNSDQ